MALQAVQSRGLASLYPSLFIQCKAAARGVRMREGEGGGKKTGGEGEERERERKGNGLGNVSDIGLYVITIYINNDRGGGAAVGEGVEGNVHQRVPLVRPPPRRFNPVHLIYIYKIGRAHV